MGFLEAIRTTDSTLPTTLFRATNLATKGWEELRAGITQVSSHGSGNLVPTVQTAQALKKYRSWIYPCVKLISRKVSEIPYYLYKDEGKGDKEAYERIYNHPVLSLLKKPNKYLSGRQFKEIVQMYLDLCGFAVAKIIRRASGQPCELQIMYPHELTWIELGTNTDNIIKAFHFAPMQSPTKKEIIPYEECLYFHYPHPENPYMPYTPIQAMAHATDLDLYMQSYEKDFFHNGARPDFVIIPDRSISEPTAKRVQEGWIARHRGPGKHFKPAVLSESMKIQQLSMTARDFEFPTLAEWTKDQILVTYQVPEAMFGLFESFNKASSITAETIFVNNSINPRLDLFEDVINHQLLPMYKNTEGLELEHVNAKPKDDEWELAEATGKISIGLMTLNEYRERQGLPRYGEKKKGNLCDIPWLNGQPIPGIDPEADKVWRESMAPPPNLMGLPTGGQGGNTPPLQIESNNPAGQGAMGQLGGRPPGSQLSTMVNEALRSSRPTLSALLNATRGNRGGLSALIRNNANMHSLGAMLDADRADTSVIDLLKKGIYDYIERELISDSVDRMVFKSYEETIYEQIVPLEEKLKIDAEAFFVQKGIELANIIEKAFSDITVKGTAWLEDMEEDELREDYRRSMYDFAVKAVDTGFRLGCDLVIKAGGSYSPSDVGQEASINAAGIFLDRSSDLKVRSTKKALEQILQEGLKLGMDSTEVAELIRKRFSFIGARRADTIARTELAAAVWVGQDASFQQINKDANRIVVKRALFFTSLDERVCKKCDGLHKKAIKDYTTSVQSIEMPPHPLCRCVGYPELV